MASRHVIPVVYSVLLHAALASMLVISVGRNVSRAPAAPPSAIQAAVVDEDMINAELGKLEAAERQRQVEREKEERELAETRERRREAEEAERQRQAELEQQRRADEQAEVERKARLDAQREELKAKQEAEKLRLAKIEEQRKAEETRLAKLEAERKAREEAERKAKEDAERKAAAERKKREEAERREAERRAEEERQRVALAAASQAEIEAEMQALRDENAAMLAQYETQIRQRVERNWARPPSAGPGLRCVVRVRQIPGGDVVDVRIGDCNGDEAVKRSIEAAVFRAAPLPAPPHPSLFDRQLRFIFAPTE